jgi:hypothetical protein
VFLFGEIMFQKYICFFRVLFFLPALSSGAQQQAIDTTLAARYFQEARAICAKDNGELWGVSLYGPMMFVDRSTRMIVANQSDAEGRLVKKGEVFVGRLPDEENIANTATYWAGVKWTMIISPLPTDELDRARLMLHELFHRVQDDLGFPLANPSNNHLDSFTGRLWLQLEWRALQRALTRQGAERQKAIEDALVFRAHRREIFPQAARNEDDLELNEGLAEYTGVTLCGTTDAESVNFFVKHLQEFEARPTFVRSFAYASGPAYGLLLDKAYPNWRKSIKQEQDFGALLAKALAIKRPVGLKQKAEQSAKSYDGDTLFALETERENKRKKRVAAYRARFVEGAVLTIPLTNEVRYGFNPNNLEVLDESNTVFPNVRVSDVWGILTVANGAILTRKDGQIVKVTVCAPTNLQAKPLQGDGWTLELKAGWKLEAGERRGDYIIKQ